MSVTVQLKIQLSHTATGLEVRSDGSSGQTRELAELPPPVAVPSACEAQSEPGRRLYEALISGTTREALQEARNEAARRNGRVALQLRFDPDAVDEARHPWELLHDGQQFLLLAGVDLTRYVTFQRAVVPVTVDPPLRVLMMAPSPSDLPPVDVEPARRALGEIANVEFEELPSATYHALLRRLVPYDRPVHVFDFEGHGGLRSDRGGVCFETTERTTDFVTADGLGVALQGSGAALAVVNACRTADLAGATVFNSIAPALILNGVPAVVGMQGPISDRGANDFLRALFEGLSHFLPVTTAVAGARRFLYPYGEWHKPALYLRSTDENGRILAAPPAEASARGGAGVTVTVTASVDPVRLLQAMQKSFGYDDFQILCFRLGVRMEVLSGDNLWTKMIALIEHHRHRDRYTALVEEVLAERPHLRQELLA